MSEHYTLAKEVESWLRYAVLDLAEIAGLETGPVRIAASELGEKIRALLPEAAKLRESLSKQEVRT